MSFLPRVFGNLRRKIVSLTGDGETLYSLFSRSNDNKEVCGVVMVNGQDVDKPLRELKLPGGLLALAIRRDGELLVPHGNTRLCRNDRLTLVGSLEDIELAKQRFTENESLPD